MVSHMAFTQDKTFYTTQDLDMENFYIIDENDYWHDKLQYSHAGKCIVTNCAILSVTLYIAGIWTPNGKDTAAAEKKPH